MPLQEDKVQNVTPRPLTTASSLRRKDSSHIGRLLEKGKQASFDPEKINQAIEAVEKI